MNNKPQCDWCNSTEDQEMVGEDWTGHIYMCRQCSHEYVVVAETKSGKDFIDFIKDFIK